MSWVRRPSGGVGKYIRLSTHSSDVEKHLDDESSSSDGSSSSEEYNYDDNVSLLKQIKEKTDYRIQRRSRKMLTVVLPIAVILGSLTLIFLQHKQAKKRAASIWEDKYITNNVINESIPDCKDCQPYSALPDYPLPLKSYQSFNVQSMDHWISTGTLPNDNIPDFSNHTKLDGVTFWVNGSDPRHKAARFHFSKNVTRIDRRPFYQSSKSRLLTKRNEILNAIQGLQNTDNRFREHNELLYSLRSAKESLQGDLGTLHVISTDYWDNEMNEIKGKQDRLFDGRRGQLPLWLNVSSELVAFGNQESTEARIRFHHDWETFTPMVKTRENIDQWRMKRLPSFNSIAAEAVLGVNLPTLSEYSFLGSDDMFLGQKMSTADFITPLYGPVLHLDMHHMVKPSNKPWSLGEMAGLRYSIHLLKKRFGTRQFPYPMHVHKALSKPLLIESKMMWKEEFEKASAERFRGGGLMANSHMLLNGLTVERHREALLWSFLVSKIDTNGDGVLDPAEEEAAFTLMGTDGVSDITGRMRKRTTTNPEDIDKTLKAVSFPRPLSSKYLFSSMDGYSLSAPSSEFEETTGILYRDAPPRFFPSSKEKLKKSLRFSTDYCKVSMNTCWPQGRGGDDVKTKDVFTLFAFQEPSCGDCLIMHLVDQSGSGGLEAFLPDRNLSFPAQINSSIPSDVPAHLPLGDDWTTLDFSLSAIAGINRANWNRRDFSVALIQRYSHIIATSSAKFEQISSPSSAKLSFRRLLQFKPAFICINDDIRSWRLNQVKTLMSTFFETMWPSSSTRLAFEL